MPSSKISVFFGVFSLGSVTLFSSCAPSSGEKDFLPYVIQDSGGVQAISEAQALEDCQVYFCEKNHIYRSQFGRKRHSSPPPAPPMPIREPSPTPSFPPNPNQPPETLDYSREIMDLSQAWQITEGNSEVLVAVVDSGVEYTHPDLVGNVEPQLGYDFYNNDPDPMDDNGHGTHVAGIIAALKNSIGTRGVAPQVKLIPIKFLGANGSGDTADAIKSIEHAISKGAKIISNSWGGYGYSELLNQAIQRAHSEGVIVVAAAGNDGLNTDYAPVYPAGYPSVISVGSTDASGARSSFSNYGVNSVTLFAPGSDIYSTYPGGNYRFLSGTSMAAPQVSGVLALALSLKSGVSTSQVREELCDTSTKTLTAQSQCGQVNAGELVRVISTN